ncbi:MAG TPA: prepilin peptidase [Verrucomicrobiota bacterium]|nr:prepilin peptidase [Verrucomicrobiota bacterium]
MVEPIFEPKYWAAVPFHFWSVVFFVFGSMVGSFLNVCIHRMPLGQSIVSPPSHCPHCHYAIPWYLNIPLVTWIYLRARCRNCGAPISARYFLVELLAALLFLACWLSFGPHSAALALIYSFFLAALVAATFIDLEHFIIPDEITLGGAAAGFVCSFLVPSLHGEADVVGGMKASVLGMSVGAGLVYAILRLGKVFFGRQRLELKGETRVVFTETALVLPDRSVPYEDIFYRDSDSIGLRARRVEMVDRCYQEVMVRLSPTALRIGEDQFNPEQVPYLEALCNEVVLPREAMGLGDVKFMAAIGAFLGWKAVVFSLLVSSMIGAVVGLGLVALRRREFSSRLPYGPYIALAAALWLFAGPELIAWYRSLFG